MPLVDKHSCESIQCGATTQLEAGIQAIMDCSAEGYSLARSCLDPICVGDLAPSYCAYGDKSKPQQLVPTTDLMIPYSPSEFAPINETSTPPLPYIPPLPHETKRRRSYYQEQVMCPGGETNPFFMGMNTWKSLDSVMNTIPVMGDLGLAELAGFLIPALGIGLVGYLYLNGKLFK